VNYGNGANGGIHLSSNAYLAFGGASATLNLSASDLPFPTLFLGAGNNSYQRVYAGLDPGGSYRVRYEGTAATTGTPGAPNIVFEIVFEPSGALQVAIGAHARCPGGACVTGISDGGGGWYLYGTNMSVALDTRYRFGGLAGAATMGTSAPFGMGGLMGITNWACISASALPVSLGVVGADPSSTTYDCGMLANATGYAVFGMTPAEGGGFNCLVASSPSVTAADLMAGGTFLDEQCGTPCFPDSYQPVCGLGSKAYVFESFGEPPGGGGGGGKSYNFSDLACIPGALMPVPLGPAVPAVEGATSACADQAAADGRTLFAMKPSNTTGSFDCFGAANASATSADILAAAATYAPLGYGDCDTPCFGAGKLWPICGKGDNAFLFDVRITSGPAPGGPPSPSTATSPLVNAFSSPGANLIGPGGLSILFDSTTTSTNNTSTNNGFIPLVVPFPFVVGNVRACEGGSGCRMAGAQSPSSQPLAAAS